MKKYLLLIVMVIMYSCGNETEQMVDKTLIINTEPKLDENGISTNPNAVLTEEMVRTKLLGSPTNELLRRPTPPKKRNITMTPQIENNNPVGRIAETPVAFPDGYDYTISPTFISNDIANNLVDWDNDGDLDRISLDWDVNSAFRLNKIRFQENNTGVGVFINYALTNAVILGFDDVDGDGFTDIILQGGNPNKYNYPEYEQFNAFNVAYNRSGQLPLHPADIWASMIVTDQQGGNPNNIIWDWSAYGDWAGRTFYIDVYEVCFDWDNQIIGCNYLGQTWAYDSWGFYFSSGLDNNTTYYLHARGLGSPDGVEAEFER